MHEHTTIDHPARPLLADGSLLVNGDVLALSEAHQAGFVICECDPEGRVLRINYDAERVNIAVS